MTTLLRSDAAFEARLRRLAGKKGYTLRKSRRHLGTAANFGGFMLVDAGTNCLVAGRDFDLTPSEVADLLNA